MHTQRRYSKRELLGQLRVEYLFSVHELPGITSSSSRWEILGAFLKAGEARAERLIETDGGFVFSRAFQDGEARGPSTPTTKPQRSSYGCASTETTTLMASTSITLCGRIAFSSGQAVNWWTRCPSCEKQGHDKSGDNLAISVADPRFYKCWAGCTKEMIREALGFPIRQR